jgi:hypothetical protein
MANAVPPATVTAYPSPSWESPVVAVVTSTFPAGVGAVESSLQASTSAEVMSVSVEKYGFWNGVTEKASWPERRSRVLE